ALRNEIDVIRTISMVPTVVAVIARRSRKISIVANVSDFYSDLYAASHLPVPSLATWLIRKLEAICLKADCLIVDTEEQRVRWELRGFPASRCVVLPHGLPRSLSQPPPYRQTVVSARRAAPQLFYVGDISEVDGVDWLIRALRLLIDDGRGAMLLVVGTGTSRNMRELRQLAGARGLDGHVQ